MGALYWTFGRLVSALEYCLASWVSTSLSDEGCLHPMSGLYLLPLQPPARTFVYGFQSVYPLSDLR
jgi:hypothetical protein